MTDFDIIIVGGGMVGLATACALQNTAMNIAIIEPNENLYHELETMQIAIRASAINHASQLYLQQIGGWDDLIVSGRVQSFDSISVREKAGISQLSANSFDYKYANLGYIIENQIIQNKLYQQVNRQINNVFYHSCVSDVFFSDDRGFIELENGKKMSAKLIIAADGANSSIRQKQAAKLLHYPYRHHAIIATVNTELSHQACARQQFYEDGIIAFLPLWQPNTSCLVWSLKPEQANKLSTIDENVFNQILTEITENWLGKCQLMSARQVFPLVARYCPQNVMHRLVLIGDAAHTIHPLAGQGVNLGLQDSKQLTDIIIAHYLQGRDFGLKAAFNHYQVKRHKDTLMMLAAMHTIQNTFDGHSLLKRAVRGIGTNMINSLPLIKKQLIKYALGI